MSATPRRSRPAAPLAVGGLLLAIAQAHGFLAAVLPAVPLLLLLASLLLGLYPGCETAVRLSERIASRVRTVAAAVRRQPRPLLPASHAAGGGLLLAFSLSGRAPPAGPVGDFPVA